MLASLCSFCVEDSLPRKGLGCGCCKLEWPVHGARSHDGVVAVLQVAAASNREPTPPRSSASNKGEHAGCAVVGAREQHAAVRAEGQVLQALRTGV